jgi:hypothetical protein
MEKVALQFFFHNCKAMYKDLITKVILLLADMLLLLQEYHICFHSLLI